MADHRVLRMFSCRFYGGEKFNMALSMCPVYRSYALWMTHVASESYCVLNPLHRGTEVCVISTITNDGSTSPASGTATKAAAQPREFRFKVRARESTQPTPLLQIVISSAEIGSSVHDSHKFTFFKETHVEGVGVLDNSRAEQRLLPDEIEMDADVDVDGSREPTP